MKTLASWSGETKHMTTFTWDTRGGVIKQTTLPISCLAEFTDSHRDRQTHTNSHKHKTILFSTRTRQTYVATVPFFHVTLTAKSRHSQQSTFAVGLADNFTLYAEERLFVGSGNISRIFLACKNSFLCPATEPDKASFHFHWPRFDIVFDFSVQ